MTKQEFVMSFVTQFLSSYAATHYDECAIRGDWDKIITKAPIEDALTIAEDMWDTSEFQEIWRNNL